MPFVSSRSTLLTLLGSSSRLKRIITLSDNWDFYFANVNDKLASLFVDLGIRESVPDAKRPWLNWVWVYFNQPRKDGLSTSEESPVLSDIEDALNAGVDGDDGILSGRITTDGRREFYYYGPSDGGFTDTVARVMSSFPDYSWDADTKYDPDWGHYLDVLYPQAHDWQRIKNRRVIEQLEQHGDPLTKKRAVFHWAYFSNEAGRASFVSAIQEHGFIVTNESDSSEFDSDYPCGVSFERDDHVDWDSINEVTIQLSDLATENDGDYDGWETSIEKEA